MVGSGEVRPTRYVKIMSEVSGRVEQVYVEPGQEVTRGQALLLIEPQSRESKRVTQYSPLKGVVADISTRVGETVFGRPTDETLITIADMSRIYVEVNIDGPDLSKVAVGQSARIIVNAFHEEKIRGFVINKNPLPVAQSETPEFRVTIQIREIPNAIRERLRPGMSATAFIRSRQRSRQPKSEENLLDGNWAELVRTTIGTREMLFQVFSRVRRFHTHDLLRRACCHNVPARVSAFRS